MSVLYVYVSKVKYIQIHEMGSGYNYKLFI